MTDKLTANELFWKESRENLGKMYKDPELKELVDHINHKFGEYKWAYSFNWLGRPLIQYPTDVFAVQEMIWQVKPDLIIETGIAHGGSLILSSSMLDMIGGDGQVIGIDIDIREHNRIEIEKHPMYKRITMIEGSSTDELIVDQVKKLAKGKKNVMVFLDSCHTHEHVLGEMEAYSNLVGVGSYLVVYDTCVEFMDDKFCANRPWGKGNSPFTAVKEFLDKHKEFEVDENYDKKYILTCLPNGRLKRIK